MPPGQLVLMGAASGLLYVGKSLAAENYLKSCKLCCVCEAPGYSYYLKQISKKADFQDRLSCAL